MIGRGNLGKKLERSGKLGISKLMTTVRSEETSL